MKLNKYIDHTLLKAEATKAEIEKLCQEARQYDFATVCVNPIRIPLAKKALVGSKVGITTVVGFPLGATFSEIKANEALRAIKLGATEIDMVLNIGALKDKNYDLVLEDLKRVRNATTGFVLKVILETCLLEKDEIIKACELCVQAKVDFVKTSTGFSKHGALVEDVKLMKQIVGDKIQVKAAGGIRTLKDAQEMIAAGASRLGTSGGIAIMNGLESKNQY